MSIFKRPNALFSLLAMLHFRQIIIDIILQTGVILQIVVVRNIL